MSTKVESPIFQTGADIPWESTAPGLQRKIYGYDDRVMLVKVKFEQGAIGTMHQHPHTQVTYVESGAFEFTIGNETRIIRAGDGCYMPSNVMHGCTCLEAGVLIDTFSPHREDFLTQ
ncbi:quercetin dioxygenase-like cupin family protein [Chitinophaga dinghuensis]|uniref:Quercetin dioxygenase-like cupin family protein n=1 Tax=Chitinophaga dinghuensis TaxID=1539050 RepID=A0A327W1P7_9BACT|nr:cupin domain-containing protein [Chitinophaga dinghuensis]RAJ81944.1 quercetin dioxygenase-like cupin family protein [Chitinophaga dinghuensis]